MKQLSIASVKFLLLIVLTIFALGTQLYVHAQVDTTNTETSLLNEEEMQRFEEQRKQRELEMRPENGSRPDNATQMEAREQLREEKRVQATETSQHRLANLANNVVGRFVSVTTRVTNIITRIDSRIVKIKAMGIDTAPAEAKLAEAKTELENVKQLIATFGNASIALSSDNPQEVFKSVRTSVQSARDSLGKIRTLLKETVTLLKEAVQASGITNGVSPVVSESNNTQQEAVAE